MVGRTGHTHASCNAVTLVWSSLRLAPISQDELQSMHLKPRTASVSKPDAKVKLNVLLSTCTGSWKVPLVLVVVVESGPLQVELERAVKPR